MMMDDDSLQVAGICVIYRNIYNINTPGGIFRYSFESSIERVIASRPFRVTAKAEVEIYEPL
jgi:hypothetical protein